MRYRTWIALDPATAGALGYYVFRANSIYDPDYSAAGHQPMGYDQLSALYAHYVVLSSTIVARYRHFEATDKYLAVTGVLLSSSYTPVTNLWTTLVEQPRDVCSSQYSDSATSTSGQPLLSLRGPVYNAKKFFGVKDPQDAASTIGASVTTNPSDGAYFIFWTQSPQGFNISSFPVAFELDYEVLLFEPEEIAAS